MALEQDYIIQIRRLWTEVLVPGLALAPNRDEIVSRETDISLRRAVIDLPCEGAVAGHMERMAAYMAEVLRANERQNLVTRRDPGAQVLRNILDSWFLALVLRQVSRETTKVIVDAGSGSGVPGIPAKALLECWGDPAPQLVLVESKAKKAEFLEYATRELKLENTQVLASRLEDLSILDCLEEIPAEKGITLCAKALASTTKTLTWAGNSKVGYTEAYLVKSHSSLEEELPDIDRWAELGWNVENAFSFPSKATDLAILHLSSQKCS